MAPAWDDHWDTAARRSTFRSPAPCRRGVKATPSHGRRVEGDVHGHRPDRTHYLQTSVRTSCSTNTPSPPGLVPHESRGEFNVVADATGGPQQRLAAVPADQVMNMEIGVCASTAKGPTAAAGADSGIVACFTCPERIPDRRPHPGLLAAVGSSATSSNATTRTVGERPGVPAALLRTSLPDQFPDGRRQRPTAPISSSHILRDRHVHGASQWLN